VELAVSWVGVVWVGMVGASLASFSRLAALRLARGQGLCLPPSHCDGCGARIRARHLIPVLGWCLARGRCPVCEMRVTVAHPCIEAISGVVWAAAWLIGGDSPFFWGVCALGQGGLFLADFGLQRRRCNAGDCRVSR